MKIALVMPKSTFLEQNMIFQPLGLFYLAARLESLGHQTDFYDLNVDDMPRDVYDQVWVSATSPQMQEIKRVGTILSRYQGKSVLGGASAWANPDSCRNLGYDLIVSGESDSPQSMETILDHLTWRYNISPHLTVPISKGLDWVLPPVRRWSRKYKSQLKSLDGNMVDCTTMFTSRGCPLECAFCESGRHGVIWDRLTRYEPLEVVEEQIRQAQCLDYGALAYYDDILPLNKKRTAKILELHQKYGMIWRCFLRSDIINNQGGYDYLKDMRDGGLVEIFVGVESASNEIKNGITKKTTIEQDTNIVQWCKRLGIRCKTSFILGLPGETMETMEETRRWILEHRPARVQVGRLIPFAGTPLTKHPENYDLTYETQLDDNWFYAGKHDMDTKSFVSTSNLTTEEIDDFWRKLVRELDELGIST